MFFSNSVFSHSAVFQPHTLEHCKLTRLTDSWNTVNDSSKSKTFPILQNEFFTVAEQSATQFCYSTKRNSNISHANFILFRYDEEHLLFPAIQLVVVLTRWENSLQQIEHSIFLRYDFRTDFDFANGSATCDLARNLSRSLSVNRSNSSCLSHFVRLNRIRMVVGGNWNKFQNLNLHKATR